jgi:hypothetical protein
MAVAGAMLVLFGVALGIFLLPFAFPTPPPIVTRFQSTVLFSPNADGRRDQAVIGVRLSEASDVTIEIQSGGESVTTLLDGAPRERGFFTTEWDGLDAVGRRVPDGTYAIKLLARSGEKRFSTTRNVTVDTSTPQPAEMTVESATLAGPGRGECRVAFSSRDAGSLVLEAVRSGGDEPLRRLGPRPVRPGQPVRWDWSGVGSDGARVAPGLYVIRATLSDAARNRVIRDRTCWVGFLSGRATPGRPAPRDRVGVTLRRTDGTAVPPSTPVALVLRRRTGIPGVTGTDPLGVQVGSAVRGRAGRVRIRMPAGINPAALWLVATADGGSSQALIDLGGLP